MTITQLCECSSDELDKMSMADLEEHFKPFWPTTRPVRKAELFQGGLIDKSMLNNRQPKANNKVAELASKLSPEKLKWLKEQGIL